MGQDDECEWKTENNNFKSDNERTIVLIAKLTILRANAPLKVHFLGKLSLAYRKFAGAHVSACGHASGLAQIPKHLCKRTSYGKPKPGNPLTAHQVTTSKVNLVSHLGSVITPRVEHCRTPGPQLCRYTAQRPPAGRILTPFHHHNRVRLKTSHLYCLVNLSSAGVMSVSLLGEFMLVLLLPLARGWQNCFRCC